MTRQHTTRHPVLVDLPERGYDGMVTLNFEVERGRVVCHPFINVDPGIPMPQPRTGDGTIRGLGLAGRERPYTPAEMVEQLQNLVREERLMRGGTDGVPEGWTPQRPSFDEAGRPIRWPRSVVLQAKVGINARLNAFRVWRTCRQLLRLLPSLRPDEGSEPFWELRTRLRGLDRALGEPEHLHYEIRGFLQRTPLHAEGETIGESDFQELFTWPMENHLDRALWIAGRMVFFGQTWNRP